jgi:hypothetical protein
MWLARNKISVIWLVLVTSVMGVFLFPHGSTPLVTIITNLLFVTLFVLSLFIVIREKNWNNKAIFLNFTLFGAYFLISDYIHLPVFRFYDIGIFTAFPLPVRHNLLSYFPSFCRGLSGYRYVVPPAPYLD